MRETGTGQQVAQLHDRYDDDDDFQVFMLFVIQLHAFVSKYD
jgi:hypothetical protein